jgi:3-oxosteroid 1-dehydrogenase
MQNAIVSCDVLVIGSGSAGCSAALRAAADGLKVVVIEKSKWLGGTSAMSGAGVWIPANHVAAANGIADTREEAMQYLRAAAPEGWEKDEGPLWEAFVDAGPRMLAFVEEATPINFRLLQGPDPISGKPGSKKEGRMVSPMPLSLRLAGPHARKIRPSTLKHIFTFQELVTYDVYHHPIRASFKLWPKLLWRLLTKSGGQGTALMAGLVRGCLDLGVVFKLETRAKALLQDDIGNVTGAVVDHRDSPSAIMARRGVVLATGGFEWDRAMLQTHFPGPIDRLATPRTNEGDGHKMAAAIGAKMERMDQANVYPTIPTRYERQPLGLPSLFQAEPHSIIVDRQAKRFFSETDYNIGEAIDRRDPETGEPVHLPCFVIGDHRFLRASPLFRWYQSYDRKWIHKAGTLDELAGQLGLPAAALKQSVARFNSLCDRGRDEDFFRGESGWQEFKPHSPALKLGRIDKPPFVGMSFNRSILGTKGGARTNANAQVLREDNSIIAGLYAAGLAMANPIGTRAMGIGTTIGPNMTWGFIAAETISKQNRT